MKTGSYIIIKDSYHLLCVDKTVFGMATADIAEPILWCCDGLFCLIPKEVVQNIIDSNRMSQQIDLKCTPPKLYFHWSQGIPISNLAGRALMGE